MNEAPDANDGDPRRIARAAAEALFAPKQHAAVQPASNEAASAPAARKPRILSITTAQRDTTIALPGHDEPLSTPIISTAQIARLRAYLDYGMSIAQVATVFGVAAGEIERVLQQA